MKANPALNLWPLMLIANAVSGQNWVLISQVTELLTAAFLGIPTEPELRMTVPQIIKYHGYEVEVHNVTTYDGYILSMQRIPYGKSGPDSVPRPPVILLHGLMCSSIAFVWNTPDKNLPYILADAGYDVWLANFRGNDYGLSHTKLSQESKEFWDFCCDEMAKYDLPDMTDFILNATGFNQIQLIGHSMGTTIAFASLSSLPEYNKKVKSFIALAPTVTLAYIKSIVQYLAPFTSILAKWLSGLEHGKLNINYGLANYMITTLCSIPAISLHVCTNAVFAVIGPDYPQLNQSRVNYFLSRYPTSTSVRTLQQHGQMVQSKKFNHFDFGSEENQIKYHQKTPLEYNISKITVPVALFWGESDFLASPEDVAAASSKLSNMVLNYKVGYSKFNHGDFVWAIDVKSLLYDYVVDALKNYNG